MEGRGILGAGIEMFKNLALLAALLFASCAGRPLPGTHVKPVVRVSGPRMAMVGESVALTVLLYGDYPVGEMGLEISAGSRNVQVPFARGIVDVGVRRVYRYRIKFTHGFYWRLWYESKDELLGWGRAFREHDASCAGQDCPWNEIVLVTVRVRKLEILVGGGLQMGKDYASNRYDIKLSCYDCRTEGLR